MIFSSPYGELFCSVHFAQDVMVAANVCFWVVGDVDPYDFGVVHSVRAVTFVITVSFREEQAPPLPRLSRILHVPPRRAVRLGKEKCRRFHDARIDGNVGVFV